jgi:hypothetical protein
MPDPTEEQVLRLLAAIKKSKKRDDVLNEVENELYMQDEKWGEQNHPNGTGPEGFHINIAGVADRYRAACQDASDVGAVTYRHILLEEVFEAVAEGDPVQLRDELIQCAAVAVAWIEKIDRDTAKKAE